ncbi:MAG: type II toxin-antitoxin system RelE family toxin [Armatimonadota bacterium]|jgi:mRNA interferase RelE/StbE
MANWGLEFRDEARDELRRLDRTTAQRVLNKLRWLCENFDVIAPEPLTGPLSGCYKLRVGSYRVIYAVDRQRRVIVVIAVGHRRVIYEEVE